MTKFMLSSDYKLKSDQIEAVKEISGKINKGKMNQLLLGVTGSGKTFSVANIIRTCQKASLIVAHNKTLAAQLYNEMKGFFPHNAVEYFVSHYDYYQPEAYIPQSNSYIEKDAKINDQIDLLRHSTTRSLLERDDVIVISSVSCIYGLGAPENYLQMSFKLKIGEEYNRKSIIKSLVELQYQRKKLILVRGSFSIRGEILEIFPSHYHDIVWRINFCDERIIKIYKIDYVTKEKVEKCNIITIFANNHYVTPQTRLKEAISLIRLEMRTRVKELQSMGKILESQRLTQRTNFDLEMISETGSCKGIENYSRYLCKKNKEGMPTTLLNYLPKDFLLFIDESHVTLPQISSMYNSDRNRKQALIEHGFRLPSALDNRPLKYEEWNMIRPRTIFISATPGEREISYTKGIFTEQINRPTGLLDPVCEIRSCKNQVDDLIGESRNVIRNNNRVLVTVLTKKMAEDLANYFNELKINAVYLHSNIKTLERIQIIQKLREGKYDVLVGVNLIREGLDIPECSLVAILDADKEGFLRSETALVQTIGRAARNSNGVAILYADKITKSIKNSIEKTLRRREIQKKYNKDNNIIPRTIKKLLNNPLNLAIRDLEDKVNEQVGDIKGSINIENKILDIKKEMIRAAENLEFEKACKLRDKIKKLEQKNVITL